MSTRTALLLSVLVVLVACQYSSAETVQSLPQHFEPEWEKQKCPIQRGVKLLVYNSVPKTGSTSFRAHIRKRKIAAHSTFSFLQLKEFRHRRMLQEEVCNALAFIQRKTPNTNRAIFDEHMYFANFSSCNPQYSEDSVAYINIVRDPIARSISRYYYDMQIGLKKEQSTCLAFRDIEKCLKEDRLVSEPWKGAAEHDLTDGYCLRYYLDPVKPGLEAKKALCRLYYEEVLSKIPADVQRRLVDNREEYMLRDEMINYQTKHLCGQSSSCHERSNEALQTALHNMRNVYTLVGLTEFLDLSWMLLWKLFPEYFGAIDADSLHIGLSYRVTHSAAHSDHPNSGFTEEWMARHNKLDLILYDETKKLFRERVRSCFSPCETLVALKSASDLVAFYTPAELLWFLRYRLVASGSKKLDVSCHAHVSSVLKALSGHHRKGATGIHL